jgi:hypothetical protein
MKSVIRITDKYSTSLPVSFTANLTIIGSHSDDVAAYLSGKGVASLTAVASSAAPQAKLVRPQPIPVTQAGIGGTLFSLTDSGTVEIRLCSDIEQSVESRSRSRSFSGLTEWDKRSSFTTTSNFFAVEQSQPGLSANQALSILIVAADTWEESNGLSTTARQYESQFDASVYVTEPTGAYSTPFKAKPNYEISVPDRSTGDVIAAALVAKIQVIVRENAEKLALEYTEEFRRSVQPRCEETEFYARAEATADLEDALEQHRPTLSH